VKSPLIMATQKFNDLTQTRKKSIFEKPLQCQLRPL